MSVNKQNIRHTTPPHTHILFIMPCPKVIGICHKSGTGKNQDRQRMTPRGNRCFNCKYVHSKSNKLLSLVISVPPQLNNSVINPPHLSSACQQSSSSSQNTPRDNQFINSKDSNSNRNELSSPVITMPPPLNYSVINTPQLSSIYQQSSSSSQNTTLES